MKRREFLHSGAVAAGGLIAASKGFASGDQFYVPAEEEKHEFTFMQWPSSRKVHPDRHFLKLLQMTIADVANAISDFESVVMLADASDHTNARRHLSKAVTLWDVPTEDLWARDSGPIVVKDGHGQRAVRHIRFNGWGERQLHRRDGVIAQTTAEMLDFPLLDTPLVGEAGGVEQDGHGLLMAHASSWVHENRNPGMSRVEIGDALLDAYGADRIIWTPGHRDDDITDYHIDSLARFTGPGRVLINLPDTPVMDDPFHLAALDTHDRLVATSGLTVEVIPEPETRRVKSQDFVASYANYYVCNGAVIAAQFGDRTTDKLAVEALKRHYPGREIVTRNADALGEVGGGIHCATHEVPSS
jgi:agmatine deiminase